jgi:Outer membrane protein beta-barrel domain
MMSARFSFRLLCLLTLAGVAIAPAPRAHAATNLLKGYIGASFGHANIRAKDTDLIAAIPGSQLGSFEIGHSAYQISAGIRGLEVLGAEIDYFDLGGGGTSPSWSGLVSLTSAHVSQKGEAAFGVLYLPLPVIDVYFKAGVARMRTELSASAIGSSCAPAQACPLFCVAGNPCGRFSTNAAQETTETTAAVGVGVQLKLGSWGIRGEYERFSALGEHPDLLSVGATWSFL